MTIANLRVPRSASMNLVPAPARAPAWAVTLAFSLLYLSWGTTYLAIRVGVETLPPALFGGSRVMLGGMILLAFLAWRGESLRLTGREWASAAFIGAIFFMGGNYLITMGEKHVPSGVASILVATTPLWIALLETAWPAGDRLTPRGWVGVLIGFGGVFILLAPKLQSPGELAAEISWLLVIGSAMAWAIGSVLARRLQQRSSLVLAAYQMFFGGAGLTLLGLAIGEWSEVQAEDFTPRVVYAFCHLLVVGSLMGFVAYSWLLARVPASQVGTYAYVNPVVAILVGWLLAGEEVGPAILAGVAVILTGVALVRGGGVVAEPSHAAD
jgi:drug/metabolite transporter (DMT)-like permease